MDSAPYGYLVTAAVIPAYTACAVAPRGRLGFLGVQVGELPFLWAYVLIALIWLTAAGGGLGTPVGLAGIGLAALSLSGLDRRGPAVAADRAGARPGVARLAVGDARLGFVSDAGMRHAELPGAQHSFDLFHSIRNDTAVYAIEYVLRGAIAGAALA